MAVEENPPVTTWWCMTCARNVHLGTGDETSCPVCCGSLLAAKP
jgi:DNA-directed RNA polymerase subunit RPC12/RpoP